MLLGFIKMWSLCVKVHYLFSANVYRMGRFRVTLQNAVSPYNILSHVRNLSYSTTSLFKTTCHRIHSDKKWVIWNHKKYAYNCSGNLLNLFNVVFCWRNNLSTDKNSSLIPYFESYKHFIDSNSVGGFFVNFLLT